MCSITLDLLIRGDSTEDDFSKLPALEWSVCNSSYYFKGLLDYSYREMGSIIYETGYVVLGHLWQLFLEYAFQAGQNDQTFAFIVVINDSEFDLSISLFYYCRLHGNN
jgi:hypothetical protein